MKKFTKELTGKTFKELEKQVQLLREEIAKTILTEKVNPGKDTNSIKKKRKQLAIILTIMSQKREESKNL